MIYPIILLNISNKVAVPKVCARGGFFINPKKLAFSYRFLASMVNKRLQYFILYYQ